MSDTMREIVFALAAKNSEQESVLISLDIEDDKLFLLHFIIGTYFGPDLRNHHHQHPKKKQSAFQIQASNLPTKDELSDSLMKRAEIERVYHYIVSNADPSLIVKRRFLRRYFNENRNDSNAGFPLFRDLYPSKLHPESRVRNRHKLIKSIVFITDPDTSCMSQDCVERFKRLTGLKSFTLSLNIDVTETLSNVAANDVEDEIDESMEPSKEEDFCSEMPMNDAINGVAANDIEDGIDESLEPSKEEVPINGVAAIDVEDEIDESLEPSKEETCLEVSSNDNEGTCTSGEESDVASVMAGAQAGPMIGLMDIGECTDAYIFRVSLPGVKRDERYFSCVVEDNGRVLVRGVTTTGEKQVHRHSHVFEMQTQNLCPSGNFSVSFHLPGPVEPHAFSGSFGTDGILEGIVMKKLQKQNV